MKKLTIILFAFTVLATVGCSSDPISTELSNNPQIKIGLLFEKDGCKMYRFVDGPRVVYWTKCAGSTQYDQYHSNGKGGGYYTHENQITSDTIK